MQRRHLKVYLIEDSAQVRSLLTEMFNRFSGVEVIGFAETEREALKQLREVLWDVAIIDISLSEGNGLAVLAGLQHDARHYGKRFVFTSYPTEVLRRHSVKLGADEFFDKSREMELLVNRVRELVPVE
ncbi:response regulator [Undibacterium sp. Jales W-56]|uniref:response regulator n=1 Tax=Undibacterium sp. Jales W-56 TaxID=2897325 RepID=UPI0021D3B8E0|nr:response regulator [Undibacterium sp. Jales W-56]MCU6434892.1 response regulator [Undibacterium sp. Jales W-56]